MIIGIDFDGTVVTHDFPKIGKDIGAVPILRKLVENGHKLIPYTMRSDIEQVTSDDYNIHKQGGKYLSEAIYWFKDNNIPLFGVNKNPDQYTWTTSPKPYCHIYIDDAALGCPLMYDITKSNRGFVDWNRVQLILKKMKVI